MLTRLSLLNYQSHCNTEIELGPFTVIVGPSSSGKTAVVRALTLIARNARGTSYVRHGSKSARVGVSSAQFQGDPSDAQIHVAVERGSGKSIYELTIPGQDKLTFTKCGTSVPEMINSALDFGDGDLWLAGQFDRPFLLDDTGSQVARVLGELTNVTMIYAAVRELNRRASAAASRVKQLESDLDQVKLRLREYINLPAQLSACSGAEQGLDRVRSLVERRGSLQVAVSSVLESRDRLSVARAAQRSVPDDSTLSKLVEARSTLFSLLARVGEVQARRDAVVVRRVPEVSGLLALAERREALRAALEETIGAGSRASNSRAFACALTNECEQACARLGTVLLEAGECPVCGASAEHANPELVGH